MESTIDVFRELAIALFIGALVGAERGQHAEEGEDPLLGLRTFVLVAEAGAVSALLSRWLDQPLIFASGLLAMTALILAGYAMGARRGQGLGLTTEAAALVVFLLGGATIFGEPAVPVALAIATSLLLALKPHLHGLLSRLGADDIMAGLKLLFATFIVLPILPDQPVDPWGALNPYSLWWLVILIASISLVGYVAVRWLGQSRGMALTGLFGGLVSSTAVTLAFAKRSRESPALSMALAAGVLIAWLTMAGRVLIEVAVVEASLLGDLVWPMLGIAVPSTIAALVAWRQVAKDEPAAETETEGDGEVELTNPFSLTGAIKFGLLFAVVLLAVKLAQEYAPASGVYAVSVLAGLTDVDAITLSMAQEVGQPGGVDALVATRCIVLAAFANTLVKMGVVVSMGTRPMALVVGLATVGMLIGGGGALWFMG